MRQQFDSIEVLEVIKGKDSDEATYDAARKLLRVKPNIARVYNVAGGNRAWPRRLPNCSARIVLCISLTS